MINTPRMYTRDEAITEALRYILHPEYGERAWCQQCSRWVALRYSAVDYETLVTCRTCAAEMTGKAGSIVVPLRGNPVLLVAEELDAIRKRGAQ